MKRRSKQIREEFSSTLNSQERHISMPLRLVSLCRNMWKYFTGQLHPEEEEWYKLLLYIVFSSLIIPIFLGFTFVHLFRGKYIDGVTDGLTTLFLLGSLGFVFFVHRRTFIYLINAFVLLVIVSRMLFVGGDYGSRMLWMYPLPPALFFLLGRKAALPFIIGSYLTIGIVFSGISIGNFIPYNYPPEIKIRFFISYSILCIFAYIYEFVRSTFQHYLKQKHEKLQQEISRRRQAEEELQHSHDELECRVVQRTAELVQAKEEAEVANRAKTNFLYSISHELRTPLNSVLGFAQLLQGQRFGSLNEKQVRYLRRIVTSGQHLLELINDVLDLSQIELGKMQIHPVKVNIKGLLESSLTTIREKDLKKLSFLLNIPPEIVNLTLIADRQKLKQILFHLLSNAVKFTPENGEILVEVDRREEMLIISIEDTGIGIAPEEQERIFSNFYQVQGGLCDKTPGAGLGLPITRKLVELHGGKLWMSSDGKGKGSRFSFSLPLQLPSEVLEARR